MDIDYLQREIDRLEHNIIEARQLMKDLTKALADDNEQYVLMAGLGMIAFLARTE